METQLPTLEQWNEVKNLALQIERDYFDGDVDSYLNSLEVKNEKIFS